MPADHGTPNTGDERDREVEAVARAWWAHDPAAFDSLDERFRRLQMTRAAAAIDALDRARSSPCGDHEADAAQGRVLVHRMFALGRPSPEWEQALAELRAWSMSEWDALPRPPSRDGTVAVEDVALAELVDVLRIATGHVEHDGLRRRMHQALAEFGVSERTERIHDQATKENR